MAGLILPDKRGARPSSSFAPAEGSQTEYPTVTLSMITPTELGRTNLIYPDDPNLARILTFPAMKGGEAPIKIKYRSSWQNKAEAGGSRSGGKPPGYIGYRGRRISFNAIMNSIDPRTVGNVSVGDTISTLRSWTKMIVTHATITPQAQKLDVTLKASNEHNPRVQDLFYKKAQLAVSGKGGWYSNQPDQAKRVKMFQEKWSGFGPGIRSAEIGKSDKALDPEVFELNNPLPTLPLLFRFGGLQMSPCVILKAAIIINRYAEGDPRVIEAAEIQLLLQEVLNHESLWAVTETRSRIVDIFVHQKSSWADLKTGPALQQCHDGFSGQRINICPKMLAPTF